MSERTAMPFNVHKPAWLDEFRAFIMRGNVVDLAVGIIIGVAFTAVVNSLVKDIFTPLIGMLVGGIDSRLSKALFQGYLLLICGGYFVGCWRRSSTIRTSGLSRRS